MSPASTDDASRRGPAALHWVLPSKVTVPAVRSGLIPRVALVQRLLAAEAPIVEVVAPAGYGKTTLLGQWCAEDPRPTAWVSLDSADNDAASLVSAVLAALTGAGIANPDAALLPAWPSPLTVSHTLPRLASLAWRTLGPFLLVLDHVEAVHQQESLDAIANLALSLPPGATLAVASRAEPPLPTARLRAEGMVVEIRADDLKLGADDARAVLGSVGVTLPDDQVVALVERVEGWPVGLYLAALAYRSSPREVRGRPVGGDDRIMADYLRAEVLSGLAPDTTSFLMRTSVVDQLSGPLCDALLGTAGSQHVLESLETSNLLLVPLDRTRQWYRYHTLLSDLMRAELQAYAQDEIPELHRRAARWYAANDLPYEAVTHAQAAGDEDYAAALVATMAYRAYRQGRLLTMHQWFDWFERRGAIDRHPGVASMAAIIETLLGHASAAARFADAAETSTVNEVLPDGSLSDGWVLVMRALMARHGAHQMLADAERAVELLSPLSPQQVPVRYFLGLARVFTGDLEGADTILAEAAALGVEQQATVGGPALAERAVLAIDRGDWAAAEGFADSALDAVRELHLDDYASSLVVYAVASRVASHRGDRAAAMSLAASANRLRPMLTEAIGAAPHVLVQLAHAHLELGDPAATRAVLRQLRDLCQLRPLATALAEADAIQSQLDTMGAGIIGVAALTSSELRVLPWLPTHLAVPEIAARLHLSRHTVKSHVMSIYRKLGVSSRTEAVEQLRAAGLLDPGARDLRDP